MGWPPVRASSSPTIQRAPSRPLAAAMGERRFGAAGDRLVIEECLTGPEVSFFVVSDGARALPIGSAQDHKRVFDDDRGPNTGGMGAFAPSPLVDRALETRVMHEIVEPVIAGMAAEGRPFRGFLYVGLMLTATGPKVIEFNVRLGDPEAQVVLPLVDEPLLPILVAAATGELRQSTCRIGRDRLVGIVLASRGYPDIGGVGTDNLRSRRGGTRARRNRVPRRHRTPRRSTGDCGRSRADRRRPRSGVQRSHRVCVLGCRADFVRRDAVSAGHRAKALIRNA